MRMHRRALLAVAMGSSALGTGPLRPGSARAAGFPERPVRILLPFAPGGNSDIVARLIAPVMAARLGQPVVVENRAGAGGSIGATAAARSRADGYTVLFGSTGPLSVNPAVQANLPYDAVRDFAPIGLLSRTPLVLAVTAGLPPRTLAEFIAYSKANPGRVTIASAGTGSSTHLALELFNAASGAGLTHVPYRSGGDLIPDLMAGNVASTMTEISTAMPLHREGRIRILAIGSARRSSIASDLPTFIEAGLPEYTAGSYTALLVPAGTPDDVIAILRDALAAAITDPGVIARLREMGTDVAAPEEVTPAGLTRVLQQELEQAQRAAVIAGLRQ
ncbi:Bug family tripartite tricarboxylate transporter substrate binding protein [Neoroseomonas soli]|uniref:Tripartite tricarboxylate transporter substrate binding protein n=1 Tax=Neoroseomonas soli TaxID=1081025 RepID=A0A9X9X1Q6_9PROT|nr:tripartite tricarboxylate transporter substrate binding protein [Neoroseomonas soli]MBR0673335.1 tripartite tricarboxylate transporter substrate binding protein [Neoroseomonas soli]